MLVWVRYNPKQGLILNPKLNHLRASLLLVKLHILQPISKDLNFSMKVGVFNESVAVRLMLQVELIQVLFGLQF